MAESRQAGALRYGTGAIPLPARLAHLPVLTAPGLPPAADQISLWRGAAREAAGRAAALLGAAGRLALIVPDRTRPLPLGALLPPLLDALDDCGVAPRRITLIPASGMHAPMTSGELARHVGPEAAARVELMAHDADGAAIDLGITPSGIAVAAHPGAARAGAVLSVGRIVFHYLAGFGGGRKMLAPGVAARQTILAVHARCLAPQEGAGRHPRARAGVLEGNPVHAAACEAARLFPPAVGMHVQLAVAGSVPAPPARLGPACAAAAGPALAGASVGDLVLDHERACLAYARANEAALAEPLDGVVVAAGGHPTDRDLVQAHKALDAVAPVVRDGGTVVLVAACADGAGNPELIAGLRLGGPAVIEGALRREFRVGIHTALALRQKTARLRVLALTDLSDEVLALAGIGRLRSLEDAAPALAGARRVALAPLGAALLYRLAG